MAGDAIRFLNPDGSVAVTLDDSVITEFGLIPASATAQSVTQRATIIETPIATARSNINTINALFERARRAQRDGDSTRIYVEVRTQTSDSYYRSLLIDGNITPDTEAFSAVYYGNGYLKYEISFTHAPWWEGADTQIAISNLNGSNNTAGLTIENHYVASTLDNTFTIAAGVTTGDAPAPVRLQLTNTQATALGYVIVGVLQNSASWPGNHWYQGEGYASAEPGSSTGSNAAASGGQYLTLQVPGSGSPGVSSWAITGTSFGVMDGKSVAPLMRLYSTPGATTYAGVGVTTASTGVGTDYMEVGTGGRHVLFPPVSWPPRAAGGTYAAGSFTLNTLNTGTTTTIAVDALCMFPTDCLRQYRCNDTITNGSTLVDDGINGYSYVTVSGNRTPGVVTYGTPLEILPGLATTFVVMFSDISTNAMLPAYTMSAQLYYRPRRFTI